MRRGGWIRRCRSLPGFHIRAAGLADEPLKQAASTAVSRRGPSASGCSATARPADMLTTASVPVWCSFYDLSLTKADSFISRQGSPARWSAPANCLLDVVNLALPPLRPRALLLDLLWVRSLDSSGIWPRATANCLPPSSCVRRRGPRRAGTCASPSWRVRSCPSGEKRPNSGARARRRRCESSHAGLMMKDLQR